MSKIKPAVFQISEGGGPARLICLLVPALQDAVNLELLLRTRFGPRSQVTLLGRFDRIEMACDAVAFLDVAKPTAGWSEGSQVSATPMAEMIAGS